jgi:hypothetical protein
MVPKKRKPKKSKGQKNAVADVAIVMRAGSVK